MERHDVTDTEDTSKVHHNMRELGFRNVHVAAYILYSHDVGIFKPGVNNYDTRNSFSNI